MILSPNEIAFAAKPLWGTKGLTSLSDGVGGFYSHFEVSVAVSLGESGGDTEALGRSSSGTSIGNRDHGLWQVSNRWHQLKGDGTPDILLKAGSLWRDPFVNAQMAYAIWSDALAAGKDPWTPWSVYTSGSFKTYLPDARIACKAPWAPPSAPDISSYFLTYTNQLKQAIESAKQGVISEVDNNGAATVSAVAAALASEVGGATGDLEVALKAELADVEHTLETLIKRPQSLTFTMQAQA